MPKILNFRKNGLAIRAKGDKKAEIIIYGPIGMKTWDGEGITATEFSDQMKQLDASVNELEIRINSPGGDVFDGLTIYNRLKQFKGKKTVYVDGMAASIASVIALAGDKVIMGEEAQYMIHLPWTMAWGNRNDFDNVINRLMDIEESLINIYAKKSNWDRNEIRAKVEAETWLKASEAIEAGFADETMEESVPIAASAISKSEWIRRAPKNICKQVAFVDEKKNELLKNIEATLARK